jgi:hypothetical protein
MNYYILPKINKCLSFKLLFSNENKKNETTTTNSLTYYNSLLLSQFKLLNEEINFDISNIVNYYDFFKILIPDNDNITEIYYILFELFDCFKLLNTYSSDINIGYHNFDVASIHKFIVTNKILYSNIIYLNTNNNSYSKDKIDFLFYNIEYKQYNNNEFTLYILKILFSIMNVSKKKGTSIIRIDNIFFKIFQDMLFILSNIYGKVIIIKPNLTNFNLNERYIICKEINTNVDNFLESLKNIIENWDYKKDVISIVDSGIPIYFICKLEESNIIIGQQQLELLYNIVNLFKGKTKEEGKTKEDKIENYKKNNLMKCCHYCRKYNISHNFLNL